MTNSKTDFFWAKPQVRALLLGLLAAVIQAIPVYWSVWPAWAWLVSMPLLWCIAKSPWLWWTAWGFSAASFIIRYGWSYHTAVVLGDTNGFVFVVALVALGALLVAIEVLCLVAPRYIWRWTGLSLFGLLAIFYSLKEAAVAIAFGGLSWGSIVVGQSATWGAWLLLPYIGAKGYVCLMVIFSGLVLWSLEKLNRRWPALAVLLTMLVILVQPIAPPATPSGVAASTKISESPSGSPNDAYTSTYRVGIMPGDIELDAAGDAFNYYARHSLGGSEQLDLLVWPESALGLFSEKVFVDSAALAKVLQTNILFGADHWRGDKYFNAAFLVQSDELGYQQYNKRGLVPLGEYIPAALRWIMPHSISGVDFSYSRGETWGYMADYRLGVMICSDSLISDAYHALVRDGAEWITVISNHAWFSPLISRHHLLASAVQSVAVKRDMVFVSNHGYSAFISAGTIKLYQPNELAVVYPQLNNQITVQARWGDYAWLLFLALLFLALAALRAVSIYNRSNLER